MTARRPGERLSAEDQLAQTQAPDPGARDGGDARCPGCGTLAAPGAPCPACGAGGDDPRVGQVVGRYAIGPLLGAGGMGRVYRATHAGLGEEVAVKFLLAEFGSQRETRARFRREAAVLARLRHPNVVTVLDYGEHRGEPYLVMELLRGETLESLADRDRASLPLPRVAHILDQVLGVLEAAHAEGVVHRDLKPANVMLLDGDRVKVLDFGIAMLDDPAAGPRLTATGTVQGTAQYMSPEQCVGRGVGPASDVYAVGVMLYELLAGALPFDARSPAEVIALQMYAAPPPLAPLGAPAGLEALALRALSKKPAQRPTASEFRAALELCVRGADAATGAARGAAERARAAGLSRDERALTPERERPPESRADDAGFVPRVALWGFAPERAEALRAALAVQGMTAFAVAGDALPPLSPDKRAWKALVLSGSEGAAERTRAARATPYLGALPVVVLDVPDAAAAPALIRAGASDCALDAVDDVAACQKVLRALRRGR